MKTMWSLIIPSVCTAFAFAGADPGVITAQAILMTNSQLGISQRVGVVTFVQKTINGSVQISGELSLDSRRNPISMLGMHVHAYGNLTLGCESVGPHYNPTERHHGSPTEAERHTGDLGNVIVANRRAIIDITDDIIQLTGPYSIIGRALVVHRGEDDLGKGGNEESLQTGNSGKCWACGIIGLTSDISEFPVAEKPSGAQRPHLLFINVNIFGVIICSILSKILLHA